MATSDPPTAEDALPDPLPPGVTQPELPLPFPELSGDQPLLPARMVNKYQYCPRLGYLEWVQGEWAESADTVVGLRHIAAGGQIPPPLVDGPECPRCSLVDICLPEEVPFWRV